MPKEKVLLSQSDEGTRTSTQELADIVKVTKICRFIRKTSLDELPQLVNFLKGDKTLIGPRVGLPREIEQYPSEALDRLLVPQGLSG